MKPNTVDDFWKKVKKTRSCWIWMGAKDRQGYGFFWWKNKQVRAHRFVAEVVKGEKTGNLLVCHKCDNPSCVKPDHLFVGTISDNARDMVSKGRGLVGRKRSTESIRKSAKGRRGKKWTEEMRKKFSTIRRGWKPTEETRKRMSIAHLGRKHSEVTREKMSKSQLARYHREKKLKESQ